MTLSSWTDVFWTYIGNGAVHAQLLREDNEYGWRREPDRSYS